MLIGLSRSGVQADSRAIKNREERDNVLFYRSIHRGCNRLYVVPILNERRRAVKLSDERFNKFDCLVADKDGNKLCATLYCYESVKALYDVLVITKSVNDKETIIQDKPKAIREK